jgi:hypothetical protein
MSLLNPAAAWWLLLIPALILLYIFRPRSVRLPVSSLRLWEKLPQVDRPRARLRRPPLSLLLILQALLLTAGVFALLQPAAETNEGRHNLLLLDASGSMQAGSGTSERFALAREEAREIIDGMGDLDRATLLRVGPNVTTACALCPKVDAARALEGIRAGAGQADMVSALRLAQGVAGRQESGTVETIVISDGGFSAVDEGSLPDRARFISVGTETGNRAVTELSARLSPDGRPGYAAYARIDNSSAEEVTLQVEALADTVPLPARSVTLGPGSHADLTWQLPAGAVRFTVNITPHDGLQADDSAVLFLPVAGQHSVRIVADDPDLYRRVAAGVPGLNPVVTETPGSNFAFSIIQGSLPPTLPVGSLLLINPQGELFPSEGELSDVRLVPPGVGHPVLEGVDLAALLVQKAPQLKAPEWLEPIVFSEGGAPLILVGEREGQRVAVIAFDPAQSNLPKLAAFPLLFANLVDWLYPLAGAGALDPGESLYLPPGSVVKAPGERTLQVGSSGIFADTDEAGVYEVAPASAAPVGSESSSTPEAGASTPVRFAVNMTDPTESNLSPAAHPELDRQAAATAERKIQQEYWSPLAAFALFLVGAEWLIYCWRRGRI